MGPASTALSWMRGGLDNDGRSVMSFRTFESGQAGSTLPLSTSPVKVAWRGGTQVLLWAASSIGHTIALD